MLAESTVYYDNPDLAGRPVAQRNGAGGGRTFIQAFFGEGENEGGDFYGDDGSTVYGVEQLRDEADAFRYDRDDLAMDRELENATARAEIAKRGPDWARAVGLDDSVARFARLVEGEIPDFDDAGDEPAEPPRADVQQLDPAEVPLGSIMVAYWDDEDPRATPHDEVQTLFSNPDEAKAFFAELEDAGRAPVKYRSEENLYGGTSWKCIGHTGNIYY
jgi:hypothetical protein